MSKPDNFCPMCANHYQDDGVCDRGLPAASPHRLKDAMDPRTTGLPLALRARLTFYLAGHVLHCRTAQREALEAYEAACHV
jgi:hypothetical protein